jgi:HK97 gp10 family phage protein
MAEFHCTVTGLQGIKERLAQAGSKMSKRLMRKAMTAAAQPLIDAAKAAAPVATVGTPQREPGELRDSIGAKIVVSPTRSMATARVGPTYNAEVGKQSPGVYGLFVEVGSVHNPVAHSFMRTSFDTASEAALEAFAESLNANLPELGKS